MLRSMTGYGRAHKIVDGREILVEIRAVNHRYYEFTSKIPRAYIFLEEKLKSFLQGKISRGKVEVSVTINNVENKEFSIDMNLPVAKGYIEALRNANDILGLEDDLKLSNIIRLPDIFNMRKIIEDENEVWQSVSGVADEALEKFVAMRLLEGERLKNDVLIKLDSIKNMTDKVELLTADSLEIYRNKLYNKLREVLETTDINDQRILMEAAIYSDKISVDEEIVRLRSHIEQFVLLLKSNEPVGRKLDFIIQEMNREVNTTGSKAQNIEITKLVVDMKSEIEKIREQIQNVE